MSKLESARSELKALLEQEGLATIASDNPDKVVECMNKWLFEYKDSEASDNDFYKIWGEKRMFVRSIGATDSNYSTLQVKAPSFADWQDKGWASAGGEELPTKIIQGVGYNTGRDGILKRLNPDKFLDKGQGPIKTKYAEGLLDVSGTILRTDRKISMQLHAKPARGHWQCFIPLGAEEDQALLLFMKDKITVLQIVLGTTHKGFNTIRAAYKMICAKVTRLKLAFETDLALGFVEIPSADGNSGKYKYLPKSSPKYSMNNPDKAIADKPAPLNHALQTLLRNNVSRYKSVVGMAIKNEVRCSIRHHQNPMWPMFVQWTGENREDDKGVWQINKLDQNVWTPSKESIRNSL